MRCSEPLYFSLPAVALPLSARRAFVPPIFFMLFHVISCCLRPFLQAQFVISCYLRAFSLFFALPFGPPGRAVLPRHPDNRPDNRPGRNRLDMLTRTCVDHPVPAFRPIRPLRPICPFPASRLRIFRPGARSPWPKASSKGLTRSDSPGPVAERWDRLPACHPTLHLQ